MREKPNFGEKGIPQNIVIKFAIISECLLFALALAWGYLRNIPLEYKGTELDVVTGISATGPLIAFNFGVFAVLANQGPRYKIYREFRDQVVYPLCANLNFLSAVLLGILSGIGEEFFFRGIINIELSRIFPEILAISLGSFIFAYIHFIGSVRRFLPVLLLYFLFGLYFSYIFQANGSLLVPIITHALYNISAILFIRHTTFFTSNKTSPLTDLSSDL